MDSKGASVGFSVGELVVGFAEGDADGSSVKIAIGDPVGSSVATLTGDAVGSSVIGEPVGSSVATSIGDDVGSSVATSTGDIVGLSVGVATGILVGDSGFKKNDELIFCLIIRVAVKQDCTSQLHSSLDLYTYLSMVEVYHLEQEYPPSLAQASGYLLAYSLHLLIFENIDLRANLVPILRLLILYLQLQNFRIQMRLFDSFVSNSMRHFDPHGPPESPNIAKQIV